MLFDAIIFGVLFFFVVQFLLEFRRKIIDFGVLFDTIIFGVSRTTQKKQEDNFSSCSAPSVSAGRSPHCAVDFGVLFDAITFGVSIVSWLNFCSSFDEKSSRAF